VNYPLWRHTLAAWALATGALIGPVQAQTAQTRQTAIAATPPPAADFFKLPDTAWAQLSPSGQRLAMTKRIGNGRYGLVVVDLAPGGKAAGVAKFDSTDIVQVQWVGNDWLIFSAVDFKQGSAEDRRTGRGLYAVNANGTGLRRLISRHGADVDRYGNISKFGALDWWHELLHVPSGPDAPPDEVVVAEYFLARDGTVQNTKPFWLNVRNGFQREMSLDAPANAVRWWFDRAGDARAVKTQKGNVVTYQWRAPGAKGWRVLNTGDALSTPFQPFAVDDHGGLYVTHAPRSDNKDGTDVLTTFDFAQGAPATKPLVSTPGFDFDGDIVLGADGRLVGVRAEVDAATTVWFNSGMQQMQKLVDTLLPDRVNELTCRRCTSGERVLLVHSHSDIQPGEYWIGRPTNTAITSDSDVMNPANWHWARVGATQPQIKPLQMAGVSMQRIKARDGHELPLWAHVPAGYVPGKALPTVVLVHGGPWVRGGRWEWEPMAQFLASRGYLVISPEFRGSTGYGQAHFRAGWKEWGQAMQDDVADALLWAQAKGLADKRVCIAGASYGGYATLMGLVRHPELYRCGVAWVAVTDPLLYLEGAWGVEDDISDTGRRYELTDMVGDATKDRAALLAVSPVAQAARIRAPVLLAVGESDLRVPLAHGKRLRDAMTKAGNAPVWVSYPDEGHSWRLEATHTDFAQRVEAFLAKHLLAK
jgi:acetyl esterase/lipase